MENYKVLLIDDDEDSRRLLAKAVRKEGFEVMTAENGRIGLEISRKENPHIIITDLKMPEVGGIEVLQKVKRLAPNVEVILVTAFSETETAVMALRAGVLHYIKKPIDLDQMVVTLEKATENLNLQRSLRYRTRKLELSTEIMAKITIKKELVIELGDDIEKPTRSFAQELLDTVPVGLAVLDKDMEIIYANKHLITFFENCPKKVDEKFVNDLRKIGFKELSYTSLIAASNKVLELPRETVETVYTSKYAYFMLMKIKVLQKKEERSHILMAMRGERRQ